MLTKVIFQIVYFVFHPFVSKNVFSVLRRRPYIYIYRYDGKRIGTRRKTRTRVHTLLSAIKRNKARKTSCKIIQTAATVVRDNIRKFGNPVHDRRRTNHYLRVSSVRQ